LAQPKIAIVTSKFNTTVTQMLYEDAVAYFTEKDVVIADEDIFFVPGAIEIPVVVSRLAQSGKYDAIVCLGMVRTGYVCSQVSYGCQKIAVKYGVPVIFGIVVIENNEETWKVDQYGKMGMYAADAALEMAQLMTRF
jgi:6,7-dimethyl-8-ribityllumazine synthase